MAYFEHNCFISKLNDLKYQLFLLSCIGETIDNYEGRESHEEIEEQVQDYKEFDDSLDKGKKVSDLRKEIRENLVKLNEVEAKRYYNFLSKYLAEGKEHNSKRVEQFQPLLDFARSRNPNGIDWLKGMDLNIEPLDGYCGAVDYFHFHFDFYQDKWLNFLKSIEDEFELEFKNHSNTETQNTKKDVREQKLIWKGELKEFAELIDKLQLKGWIEINDRELKPTVESICKLIDFSATKKKEDSDTANSLMQYLKPSERNDKIYSKRYTQKFSSLLPNTNEKVVTK